jgi:tetratricopeptide (TPR) repeat protein
MERAVARLPSNPAAWGTLALLYVDEERFGYNRRQGGPSSLDRAKDAAQRALRLDPAATRALEAMMIVFAVSGEQDEAVRMGERALAANPNDTELAGDVGFRLCVAGQIEKGTALIQRALALNPAHAGAFYGNLSFCSYLDGRYDAAVDDIRQANPEQHHFYNLLAAISLAQAGQLDEARRYAALFAAQRPDFIRNWDAEWKNRLARDRDRARLREGGEKAGLIAPRPASAPNEAGAQATSRG